MEYLFQENWRRAAASGEVTVVSVLLLLFCPWSFLSIMYVRPENTLIIRLGDGFTSGLPHAFSYTFPVLLSEVTELMVWPVARYSIIYLLNYG